MRITGGKLRGRSIAGQAGKKIRPTSQRNREAIFNILIHQYHEHINQAHVLDLFAGTGALGFEALSHGAATCVFVEKDPEACSRIRMNAQRLQIENQTRVFQRNAMNLDWPRKNFKKFNLVFVDPPYSGQLAEKALFFLYEKNYLERRALCVIEQAARSDLALELYFVLLEERHYGGTIIRFVTVEDSDKLIELNSLNEGSRREVHA